MNSNAAIAFTRFGLGRRRGEPEPADARGWLLAQLDSHDLARFPDLPSSAEALGLVVAEMDAAHTEATRDPNHKRARTPQVVALNELQQREQAALLAHALTTPAGFRERLVWFWYNHFTVAARTRPAAACVGAYVREAIRPHVTGQFHDMLLAVMRHPAMLTYLDQWHSVGPNSPAGQRRKRGLNENLARECLELHTVTPASGYTQADVTSFAKILTGWSVEIKGEPRGFAYHANQHEPGRQTVLGRDWPEGEEGGLAILQYLAGHPATYRHLAEKLVRHFVADDPPPADVARIETVLRSSGGDLGAASRALVELPGAWQPLTKLRTPQEYVVAVLRAAGARPEAEPKLPFILAGLGQPLFRAPFPIGWPDRAADWAGPEAMLQRVDFAYQFAGRVTDQEPLERAQATLGPLLGAETLAQMRHAGSRQDALALFFAAPEFQRR
jgi:uncharacterized protein (DUF1800 family)